MALTATTIATAIDAVTNYITITTATSFVAGQYARIDNEYVKVQGVSGTNLTVMRGVQGTQAVAHKALADCVTGLNTDFPIEMFPIPGSYTYSVDGAITVAPGLHKMIKATAAAMTLAAPTRAQEGIELMIVALTGAAHVVTGVFSTGFTTLTYSAVGDTATLVAVEGTWFIKYLNSVTAG